MPIDLNANRIRRIIYFLLNLLFLLYTLESFGKNPFEDHSFELNLSSQYIDKLNSDTLTPKNLHRDFYLNNNLVFQVDSATLALRESLRLAENYQYIQVQQQQQQSIYQLRNSVKSRTYISLGVGLASSALFLLSDVNQNSGGNGGNGFKYAGVAFSLSIPIISLITMKRQMNKIAPVSEIDYSQLQNPGYPVSQGSILYFSNRLKADLIRVIEIANRLEGKNQVSENLLVNEAPEKVILQFQNRINEIDNWYITELFILHEILSKNDVLASFDTATQTKIREFKDWIQNSTQQWEAQNEKIIKALKEQEYQDQ